MTIPIHVGSRYGVTVQDDGGKDLVARAREGDMEAFARFYDDNAEALLRFFQSRTACPDTAAARPAGSFASALASLDGYRPGRGPGRAWLVGIARNQLGRYLRWRRVDSRARERLGMSTTTTVDEESYRRIEELAGGAGSSLRSGRAKTEEAKDAGSPRT